MAEKIYIMYLSRKRIIERFVYEVGIGCVKSMRCLWCFMFFESVVS